MPQHVPVCEAGLSLIKVRHEEERWRIVNQNPELRADGWRVGLKADNILPEYYSSTNRTVLIRGSMGVELTIVSVRHGNRVVEINKEDLVVIVKAEEEQTWVLKTFHWKKKS